MAKQVITVCDMAQVSANACTGTVASFRIWVDGDKIANGVDLCESHAESIRVLQAVASEVELPARPRAAMQVTKLRTTDATKHLKKG